MKFLVWKLDELLSVCTPGELKLLDTIIDRILRKREAEGATNVNKYIVVNENEPYAKLVQDIIDLHSKPNK